MKAILKGASCFIVAVATSLLAILHLSAEENAGDVDGLSTRYEIRKVQRLLRSRDYYDGEPDGVMNAETSEAIRAYQKDWAIPETGEISKELIDRLDRSHAATKTRWTTALAGEQTCELRDEAPVPQSIATWSGSCVDGKVAGYGKLIWSYVRKGERIEATYEGDYKRGMMEGKGRYTFASGNYYEGDWYNDTMQGNGVFVWQSGSRYEGEYSNGSRHGEGKYQYSNGGYYLGEYKNGSREGYGIRLYADGDKYEGEWKSGNRHGHGVMVYESGSRYEGEWENGQKHGEGVYETAGGIKYQGQYEFGTIHGNGVLEAPSGAVYSGSFFDGAKHGEGDQIGPDGSELHYTGEYFGGEAHGFGKLELSGMLLEGEFRNGSLNGVGAAQFSTGNTYDGEFRNSLMHGNGTLRFVDGGSYTGDFRDGSFSGMGRYDWPDGSRYRGQWQEDLPHGFGEYVYAATGESYSGLWEEGCFFIDEELLLFIFTTEDACRGHDQL